MDLGPNVMFVSVYNLLIPKAEGPLYRRPTYRRVLFDDITLCLLSLRVSKHLVLYHRVFRSMLRYLALPEPPQGCVGLSTIELSLTVLRKAVPPLTTESVLSLADFNLGAY